MSQNFWDIVNYALLLGGIAVQMYALRPASRVIRELPDTNIRWYWQLLKVMILFFIAGYAGYGILGLTTDTPLVLIVSAIFFCGAWFVLLVCMLAHQTVGDIQRISQLEKENITDALTGLFNRRYLDDRLEQELKRARRYDFELSVLMIDVDHFKRFNDSFGHDVGDAVLQSIAGVLMQNARDTDIAARYGGEEMTLVLPNTGYKDANMIAERLRKSIEAHEVASNGQTHQCTVSIGGASLDDDIRDPSELLQRADRVLYTAKEQGRNCVVFSACTL